ncbi:MAG: hypothetical protein GFH27_549431n16 [Chloroflexi bacterium AL-W]|nr:hypothetical protein [Chloroflexi bacterium AL-N1]NOK71620.1 hypothetical protein [Chloroflexi bacterium AL-N10]NOK78920.1 hypothetical protein [Chloroflexi bacterium AL-N5]NOK86395.1 hypothetical protein [Chloroflexi bacterium AL-W]
MSQENWIPTNIPLDKPNPARMYDYFLGGHHNFEVDRRIADQICQMYPDAANAARANRAFLQRAMAFLLNQGIDQFLDLGSGMPTVGNVHEIAQDALPSARVAYVDSDSIAVIQSRALLEDVAYTVVVQSDIREPEAILGNSNIVTLLDFQRPVAVLMVAILHFVTDDVKAHQIIQTFANKLPKGSYLVLSHGSHDQAPPELVAQIEQLYARSTQPLRSRSRNQITAFFDGFSLVEPGIVFVPSWRPDSSSTLFTDEPSRSAILAGVGKKH